MTKKKRLGLILGISIPCGYILTLGLCLGFFFWTLSRPFTYKGKYKDLYTTAVCNIFGIQGYVSGGEILIQPYIEIIEKDNYDRTIFLYQEETSSNDTEPFYYGAVVIIQKADSENVYYYDDCYLPFYKPSAQVLDYKQLFTEEQIEDFKTRNNWNEEFREDLFFSSKIVTRPPDGSLSLKRGDFNNYLQEYFEGNGGGTKKYVYSYSRFCQTDKNGLELYYVRGSEAIDGEYKTYDFAFIVNPDKTCPINNIVEIKNIYDTEILLSQLKSNVGWVR